MKLIVVVDEQNGIAKESNLLVHLPSDLAYYKEKTLGNTVIMGRKTLESLPGARPLPNRQTILLTRDRNYHKEGMVICHSVGECLEWLEEHQVPEQSVFVSGGAEIYRAFLPYCQMAYVTRIYHDFDADIRIMDFDQLPEWCCTVKGEMMEEKGIFFSWDIYERQ